MSPPPIRRLQPNLLTDAFAPQEPMTDDRTDDVCSFIWTSLIAQNSNNNITTLANREFNILILPNELLSHCFSFLPAPDLARITQVCQNYCRVGQDNALWTPLLQQDWGIKLEDERPANSKRVYNNFVSGNYKKTHDMVPKACTCLEPFQNDLYLAGFDNGNVALFTLSHHFLGEPIFTCPSEPVSILWRNNKLFLGMRMGDIVINDEEAKEQFGYRISEVNNAVKCMYVAGSKLYVGHAAGTSSDKGFISVYDIHERKLPVLLHRTAEERGYAFDPSAILANDRYVVVGTENGTIEVWDHVRKKYCLHFSAQYNGGVKRLIWLDSIHFLSVGRGSIEKRDLHGRCLQVLENEGGGTGVQVRGSKIFRTTYNNIEIFDLHTNKVKSLTSEPLNKKSFITSLEIRGAKIYTFENNGNIYIYDFS